MASLVRQPQNRRIKKRYSDGAAVMLNYYIFLILFYFLDFGFNLFITLILPPHVFTMNIMLIMDDYRRTRPMQGESVRLDHSFCPFLSHLTSI